MERAEEERRIFVVRVRPRASSSVRPRAHRSLSVRGEERENAALWLPDGYSQIFRLDVFGPSGFWTMAPLRYAGAIQGREGTKFCHLATMPGLAAVLYVPFFPSHSALSSLHFVISPSFLFLFSYSDANIDHIKTRTRAARTAVYFITGTRMAEDGGYHSGLAPLPS